MFLSTWVEVVDVCDPGDRGCVVGTWLGDEVRMRSFVSFPPVNGIEKRSRWVYCELYSETD